MATGMCPDCGGPIQIPEDLFVADDVEVMDACPACGCTVVITRRVVSYAYAVAKE